MRVPAKLNYEPRKAREPHDWLASIVVWSFLVIGIALALGVCGVVIGFSLE